MQAHPSLATIHAVFRGIGPFGPWRFTAINEKKSRSESRNHLNIRTFLFNGLPKNTRRCFLAGLALSGVLLDFLENSLPLAQAVSVSCVKLPVCQRLFDPTSIDTLHKRNCACHAKHKRYISPRMQQKAKARYLRGNPPPSRHPDHILLALVSAAREAYRPHPGPPELNENPSLRIPNQIIICTEITGVLWPNKTLRGLSFLSTNQPLHHKQVMLTHVLNTQNSTRISFSDIWKSTVI